MHTLLILLALAATDAPAARNLGSDVTYVGDQACASCHAREAGTYPDTAMGRSMALPDAAWAKTVRIPAEGVSFVHERSGNRFRVTLDGGILKHTEIRLDEQGHEALTDTRSVAYVLGSGDRFKTFLIREGNRLFESPIAYYPTPEPWAMAPGYEAPEHAHFSRRITPPCLFCHANRVLFIEGTRNQYRDPIFDGLTIGCERCHGPGSLHVAERRTRTTTESGMDTSIVNPRRLPPALRDSVCFQCHLLGDARTLKQGRSLFDFRPGLPLSDFVAVFHARESSAPEREGIEGVSHIERLRASRCFRASGGAINCLTCHDPHRTPHGEEAEAQFRNACLTCHKTQDPSFQRAHETAQAGAAGPGNCVGCHMVKMPPTEAPHSLFTDHLIARRPAAPPSSPAVAGRDLTLVNFLEGDRGQARDLGVAYFVLATNTGDNRHAARGAAILEPILASLKGDVDAGRMMGEYLLGAGRPKEAIGVLESLVAAAPETAEYRVALATAYAQSGRTDDAITTVETAARNDPDYSPIRLIYGDLLLRTGKERQAEEQYQAALRLDPSLAPARAALGDLQLRRGDVASARDSYRVALALRPGMLPALLGLAKADLTSGQADQAISRLRQAVGGAGDDRTRSEIRVMLAKALVSAGKIGEARSELESVLALYPGHEEARKMMESLSSR